MAGEYSQMEIKNIEYRFDVSDKLYESADTVEPYVVNADFAVDYTFTDQPDVSVTNYFTLVKTNEGSKTEESMDLVNIDQDDNSVNWGIRCKTVARSDSGKGVFDEDGDMMNYMDFIRLEVHYTNFLRTGHGNVTDDKLVDISVSS